jgi:hypothetical protein
MKMAGVSEASLRTRLSAGCKRACSDENAPAQTDSTVLLRSQRRHQASRAAREVRPHRAIYAVSLWRRGSIRGDEAREWLERRRNEAIAELTFTIATIAMLGESERSRSLSCEALSVLVVQNDQIGIAATAYLNYPPPNKRAVRIGGRSVIPQLQRRTLSGSNIAATAGFCFGMAFALR